MTHHSELVFDPDDFESLGDWAKNNDILGWEVAGTSCAVAHFKREEDGTLTALPQCSDYWVKGEGGEKVTIVKGDTLKWTGTEIVVFHSGEADRPSYLDSLRIPVAED